MTRTARYVAVLLALAVTAASAQYYFRPRLPPQTVIGNPNSVYAPAQAIRFSDLINDVATDALLTPTLPSSFDINNLPPQTVIGNGTSSSAALGLITFSQLSVLSMQANKPATIYNTYDPTNVPEFTMIGNLSSTSASLALPVSIANVFGGFLLLEDNVSLLNFEDNVSHLCLEASC